MLTQWIQKIISMLLVMSAVLQVIPGKDYEKYIRFFCGLVLILLALSPVAALKGLKAEQFYQREVYQQYEKEIERMSDSIKWKERIVGYTRKIKQADRGQKRTRLAILFLCGLLLLVVAVPVPKTGEVDKDTKIDGESGKGETYETDSMADYEKYLEQKTAQTLGVVDGAGKVTVMITLKSTGQKVVEKDQQSTHQTTKEADSQGETRESEEKSLDKTTVYSQGTDGTQIPYVSKENAPEVEGILVIADGGGNAVVAKNLTEAVQALFGVEAHKIKIMKRAST